MLSRSTPNEHSSRTLRFSLCLVSVSTDIRLHRDLCLHNVCFLSPVFEFSIWMSFPVRNESLDGARVVWSTWFYQFFRTARKSSGCPCVLNCIFLAAGEGCSGPILDREMKCALYSMMGVSVVLWGVHVAETCYREFPPHPSKECPLSQRSH